MPKPRSIVSRTRINANAPARRKYTMSQKALEQRRAAQPAAVQAGTLAGKSTGPITEAGKAASCRNGWKHGRYSLANQQRFGLGATSLVHEVYMKMARPGMQANARQHFFAIAARGIRTASQSLPRASA